MKHLEEDFEMLPKIEQMYLLEKQREIEEEWREWEEQQKLPAEVNIIRKTKKQYETL
jgi:hypothetical protein